MKKVFKWGCLIYLISTLFILVIGVFNNSDPDVSVNDFNVNRDVNFRLEASSKSDAIRVLKKNETVEVLDSINNWYKVIDLNENIGFVSKNYLDKNSSDEDSLLISEEDNFNSILFILSILIIWLVVIAFKTKCIYCEKRCTVFTKAHKSCRVKYQESTDYIDNEVEEYFKRFSEENFKNVDEYYSDKEFSNLEKIAEEGFVNLYLKLTTLLNQKVEYFLEDGVLTVNEESFLAHFIEQFNLNQASYLDSFKIKNKIVKASILRNLYEEKPMKSRIKLDGNLPFKFLNKEFLVYLDHKVEYFEKRIKTTYEGGSDGISVKLMKGVYYRKSKFRGHPVKTLKTVPVGTGMLAITNLHIYFSSSNKNFRIRYDRIVSISPFEDAIGVQKEGVSSKPLTFKNIDGWFYYNFIKNSEKIVLASENSNRNSRKISQNVKDKVWNRDQGKCIECGSNEKLEFDHIIPFSKGGSNTYRNIQLLCEECNRKKSNQLG